MFASLRTLSDHRLLDTSTNPCLPPRKCLPRFGAAFLVRVGQLETQLHDACLGTNEMQDEDALKKSLRGPNGLSKERGNKAVNGTAVAAAAAAGTGGTGEDGAAAQGTKYGVAAKGNGVSAEGEEGEGEDEEAEAGRAGLYGMLLQLCSELHKHLRPKVYHGTDMDTLCEVSNAPPAAAIQCP